MSLRQELDRPESAIRLWFRDRDIPVKEIRAEVRAACATAEAQLPAVPDGSTVPWDLLGNAAGLAVVWHLDPSVSPAVAHGGLALSRTVMNTTTASLETTGGPWLDGFATAWAAGPSGDPLSDGALATIAGVFERITRSPYVPGVDAIHDAVLNAQSLGEAIAAIPTWICDDVAATGVRGYESRGVVGFAPAFPGVAQSGCSS